MTLPAPHNLVAPTLVAAGAAAVSASGFVSIAPNRLLSGRPVGLLQLPDGSLLVSDDGGNRIWRVSYRR